MIRRLALLSFLLSPSLAFGLIFDETELIQRGDANNDGSVGLSDVAKINGWLFLGAEAPPCLNQADADNDGAVNITDSLFILNWLFSNGPAPEPPSFPGGSGACGVDDNPVGCAVSPCA